MAKQIDYTDPNYRKYYAIFRAVLEDECSDVEEVFALGKIMKKALEAAIPHSAQEKGNA